MKAATFVRNCSVEADLHQATWEANRFRLLSGSSGALMSQPGRELRFLLRLQINAVVDSFDRLPVGSFSRLDSVCLKKFHDFIAHMHIAERIGGAHDFSAGKDASGFLHGVPVR